MAADKRARDKNVDYDRHFVLPGDHVNLVVLAVETTGAMTKEGRDFIKTLTVEADTSRELGQALQHINVTVQRARVFQALKTAPLITLRRFDIPVVVNFLHPSPC